MAWVAWAEWITNSCLHTVCEVVLIPLLILFNKGRRVDIYVYPIYFLLTILYYIKYKIFT